MKMTLKESPGFTALSLLVPCVLLGLLAGCTANRPTASALQPLQGTWEGFRAHNEHQGKITLTITGNSLHFHRGTNYWFETTFTLPAGTNPQQLHATIKRCGPPPTGFTPQCWWWDTIGKVVVAIVKIEDGTLTLAGIHDRRNQEPPKSFEEIENRVMDRYEFRKVQPQKQNTARPNSQ